MYIDASSPQAFCAALKSVRERRGVTLESISRQTKIAVGQYQALERADLRHWPKGLFRRAYFRDYLQALGIPDDETGRAFVRLFPDEESESEPVEPEPGRDAVEPGGDLLRLTLDPVKLPTDMKQRAVVAAADAAVVLAVAAGAWLLSASTFLEAAGLFGIPYYSMRALLRGTTVPISGLWQKVRRAPLATDAAASVGAFRPRRMMSDARRSRRGTLRAMPKPRVRIRLVR
jgi:hypothetical protein